VAIEFAITPLDPTLDRKAFSSGVPILDRYFVELVTQDVRRRVSNCFVARDGTGMTAAYYTFAAASIPLSDLPADVKRKLPRYGILPAALIGRLAVDQRFRRRGLGGTLIIDSSTQVNGPLEPTQQYSHLSLTRRMMTRWRSINISAFGASSASLCHFTYLWRLPFAIEAARTQL